MSPTRRASQPRAVDDPDPAQNPAEPVQPRRASRSTRSARGARWLGLGAAAFAMSLLSGCIVLPLPGHGHGHGGHHRHGYDEGRHYGPPPPAWGR